MYHFLFNKQSFSSVRFLSTICFVFEKQHYTPNHHIITQDFHSFADVIFQKLDFVVFYY